MSSSSYRIPFVQELMVKSIVCLEGFILTPAGWGVVFVDVIFNQCLLFSLLAWEEYFMQWHLREYGDSSEVSTLCHTDAGGEMEKWSELHLLLKHMTKPLGSQGRRRWLLSPLGLDRKSLMGRHNCFEGGLVLSHLTLYKSFLCWRIQHASLMRTYKSC